MRDNKPFPIVDPPARRFDYCFSTLSREEEQGDFEGNGMELVSFSEEGFLVIPDPMGGEEPFILDTCGLFQKFPDEEYFYPQI